MSIHIFGDESGQVGQRFLIGLLYLPSDRLEACKRAISEIKIAKGFRGSELHYKGLTKSEIETAKSIVDWYLSQDDMLFRCTVVPVATFDPRRFRSNARHISQDEMSYNVIYANAIIWHLWGFNQLDPKVIILDRKDKARPEEFDRFIRSIVPCVNDFQEVDSKSHDLLQVVDLLVGCINGDLGGTHRYPKRQVIDYLKARLGVASFQERNSRTKKWFRVSFWRGGGETR